MNTTKYMPNIHLFSFTIVYRSGCARDRSVYPSPEPASVGFFQTTTESTVNVIDLLEQKQKRKRSASVSVFSRPSNFLSRG